jgi:hypothetical protein
MEYNKFSDQPGIILFWQITFLLLFIVFAPMVALWCINVLFGTALITEAGSLHWFAMLILILLVRWRK